MSQRRVNRSQIDVEDISGLKGHIKECVRFILCKEGSKIPIKRAEIVTHLRSASENSIATNQINAVINEADKTLQRVYGYKLVKLDATGGLYIVVLNEPCESQLPPIINTDLRKMLVAALMHIYMTGAAVKEDDLWRFLMEANLLQEDDRTTRTQFVANFTKQMYLRCFKEGEGENAKAMVEWGPRAKIEVPKMFLLENIAEAFEKTPDYWYEQFKAASEEAQTENQQQIQQ